MQFDSIDKILEFAIAKEEEAAQLYRRLADTVRRPGMQATFLEFAREEEGHRARLQRMKAGDLPAVSAERVPDLKISDYLVDAELSPALIDLILEKIRGRQAA